MDADVVVLDPKGPKRSLRSSASDAPEAYPGFATSLALRHVLLGGEPRVKDGRLTRPEAPAGLLLQPAPSTLPLA